MSASIPHPAIVRSAPARPLRFGAETMSGDWSVNWLLKRNCSTTPRQMMWFYGSLSMLSLAIAIAFWARGATLVMPFAWLEVVAVGAALLVYARHAADRESIRLQADRLTVEQVFGERVERVEFTPEWVRVEPEYGERSLIELSGQGHRVAVGRFVRPELRRQFADELRWALRRRDWLPGAARGAAPVGGAGEDTSEN